MDETTIGAPQPRVVDAGRGVGWWTDGWALFTKNIGMWMAFTLILLAIFVALAFLPLVGMLAASLLTPVFMGGWMMAARKLEAGGGLEIGDLFTGFRERLTPLLVLGALLVGATWVIILAMGLLGFGAGVGMMSGDTPGTADGMMAAVGAGMLALLAGLALSFVVAIAFWFAPALVVLKDVPPLDALKASVSASLKNIGPF
ncbi:MAG TPA: BPSS1780 family membrane protein, partial [Albitalea sp.]